MTVVVTHSTPSDATFSATGATAWDATHTLTGVGTLAEQNANAVAITGGTATLTSVTTPTVQATNSAGLALKNSAGTTQISMGAGGGDNISLNSSTNINGTNAQIDISPTGTGHVHIKPTGVNSVEIAPTYVGEMDNIVIGAVTPKAGTFTTITGQTGRLNGTGQNYFTFSQTFQNAIWTKQTNVTATDNTTVAPDATTTAATIAWGSASNATGIYQIQTVALGGSANIKSIYIRADVGGGTVEIQDPAFGSGVTTVTLTTSWQRATLTESAQTGSAGIWVKKTASSPSTIYIWGAQLERGSTANTYIPTTSAAVYGTPTLSFSGVSTLGLESNGALFLQPAGTGAIQAQATTSTTAGGNVRGANAVDWQTSRIAASQVASGTYSVIGGGIGNTSNGTVTTVAGGNSNSVGGTYAGALSGISNTVSGFGAAVVTGYTNSALGHLNFIGGGFTNSGTASAAVTTQSGTMNGTTAVTLSSSNANIKVGQLITGTSIATFPSTYVAAISGTALTLSQAASGSSTSTLSFYTPHGVVVGGGNNQATGSYSFIGGGGDAGTAANRNVASGDWSTVGGGTKNSATNSYSSVLGGQNNSITTNHAFIGGGINNSVSNSYASVVGGYQNTASGANSVVTGGTFGTTRSITGFQTFTGNDNALGSGATGTIQAGLLVLGRQTTDATATALTSNTSAAGTTNQVILPNNSAYYFRGEIISGVTGGGNTKGWTIEGVIKRGANAASTALVGTPTVTSNYADAGASAWAIAVTADTTNGGLRVTFTGQAATTIRTVCQIRTTEMTY